MANSNIVITFTREAINGDITSVKRRMIIDPLNFSIENENWINYTRPAKGYIAIPSGSSAVVGANTAYLFAYYFNLDYNGYGIYAIQNPDTNSTNQVTILCTNSDWEFYDFVGGTLATAVITNFVPDTYKLISTTKQISAVDACASFGLRVITTEPTVRYYFNGTDGVMVEGAFGTDFVIDLPRGVPNYLTFQDANYVNVYPVERSQYVNLLAADNISIGIVQSISGATVTATVAYSSGLTLQYSLDGVVWQSSNIFTGQAEGDYTMYVKDNYGCTKSKTYSIYVRGHRTPFLFISEANAIGFKRQIEWDEYTTFKNDENSLAYQSDDRLLYCSNILFQTLDKTRIQFKSNFSAVSALLRKEDLSEVGLVVEKMSENLDRFTRMDATYYKYKTGKTGIFFDSGWTYTKEGAQIEEYALNGNLPDLALIGGLISIDGLGIFKIEDVIFDEAVTKKVIVINNTFEGGYTNTIVESVYDLLPFEVYEFEIDWSLYGEGIYDVAITNADEYNESIFHLSENISVLDKQENTVAIRYFNNNNRDIFYKYGIRHFIRVPIISMKSMPKDETNISINDDDIVSTKSVVHEAKEFLFGDMIDSIMLKTVIALSCDYVFIQDLGYVKEGSVTLENKSITNVYNIRATMLKKGVNYTINAGGETGIDIGSSGFTMPVTITGDTPTFIVG